MFRHIRSDLNCSQWANIGGQVDPVQMTRHKVALLFGYHSLNKNNSTTSEAETAGRMLQSAVANAAAAFVQTELQLQDQNVEIISSTQSSVARLRHESLSQEKGCAAAGDVMIVSIMAPAAISSQHHQRQFLECLYQQTKEELVHQDASGTAIELFSCKLLDSDSRLHAERSCTQRVYHYLLPFRWLPDGKQLTEWWLNANVENNAMGHTNRATTRPTSDSLSRMKAALKEAESTRNTDPKAKVASGRFGALAKKERRPWHNFADPNLCGNASPNNEPVWRVLDRARIVRFLTRSDYISNDSEEVFAVIEFRGDDFVCEQIRRVMGTALAVTHGWLPLHVFEILTRADILVETALAPEGRLYLAETRFHFDELRSSGQRLFETDVDGIVVGYNNGAFDSIQEHLLSQLSNESQRRDDEIWLHDLKHVVAPRISHQVECHTATYVNSDAALSSDFVATPDLYLRTLALLRDIVRFGKWPETSLARSNVIRMDQESQDTKEISRVQGSFTVVNPDFLRIVQKDVVSDPLPRANALFPDLVDAVFEMERVISEAAIARADVEKDVNEPAFPSMRPASSHCAINCNAQFTPHVDSGRGAGQSLSMIVGLGDYHGGELAVEGKHYDIRYRPVEFDGWKLRHWTNTFVGERFSLVWFTPDLKGNKVCRVP